MMSAIEWPQALLTEVAERRCIIVLGAGASSSATNDAGASPPDWTTFIAHGLARLASVSDREAAKELLERGAVLDAAQIMADGLGPADFSVFIRDEFEKPNFQPSRLHELVLGIDPKIVITTNYDTIYESLARRGDASAGYNVCRYHDMHLVNDLRSDRRVIVKAHGCVSDPARVVLTRRQYFDARRDYPHFFSAVDALFLSSTLLFVGTGFNGDPDIELLLQSAFISAPSQHPHYAIVEGGRHSSVKRAIEETYNVNFLEYAKGQHGQVIDALDQLLQDVTSYRAVGLS